MLTPNWDHEPALTPQPGWLERFQQFAADFFASRGVPGGAVQVLHGGQPVLAQGFGYRDLQAQLPVDASTVFGLASVSKSFTVLCLLVLQAQGRLQLSDPVTQHLPAFAYPGLNQDEPVRLLHLASNSSGLPPLRALDYAFYQAAGDKAAWGDKGPRYAAAPLVRDYDQLLDYLRQAPGERTALPGPGRYVSYSNEGFALLGAVVEKVTGTPFPAAFQELVAGPLGLSSATFDVAAAQASGRLTRFYEPDPHDKNGSLPSRPDDLPAYLGTGALHADAADLGAYLLYLLDGLANGGDARLPLSRELLRLAVTGRVWSAPRERYALGWSVGRGVLAEGGAWPGEGYGPGFTLVRHGGSLTGVSSHVGFVPALGLGVVVLANRDGVPVNRLLAAALDAYLGRPLTSSLLPMPAESARPDPQLASTLAGLYSSGEPWGRLHLTVDESGVLQGATGSDATPAGQLRLLNENEFVLVGDEGAWDAGRFIFGSSGASPVAAQIGTRWLDRQPAA